MNVNIRPEGHKNAPLIIVGEAPSLTEQMERAVFVGPAGRTLNRILRAAKINRTTDCYITNTIPYYTSVIKDYIRFVGNTASYTDEFLRCKNELIKDLQTCEGRVIVALGAIATYALTGKIGVLKWRGSPLTNPELPGKIIVPTIHPAATLRAIKSTESSSDPYTGSIMEYCIILDMIKAMRYARHADVSPIPNRTLLVASTAQDAIRYIDQCMDEPIIGFDIETSRSSKQLICFAIARKPDEAMCIPLLSKGRSRFTVEEELQLFRKFAALMESPNVIKCGHAISSFDSPFMIKRYGIIPYPIHDTMVAMRLLMPDLPASLAFITSVYTDEPFYKDEGKETNIIVNEESFWVYNAKDACMTLECLPPLMAELQALGNLDLYQRLLKVIPALWFMTDIGMRLDFQAMRLASDVIGNEVENLTQQLKVLCKKDINPNSPKELMDYFYVDKGLKPYVHIKTRKPTTDVTALRRLARAGHKEASIILEIRKRIKLKSTYMDITYDDDGRIRSSFDIVGANTGRLSSKKTIFGTGTDMQNLPPEFKQFIIADDNHIMYEMDLKQAENKIVAYIAPEPKMIEAFETGIDLHSLTGSFISGLPFDVVVQQAKEGIPATIGSSNKTWRDWGKRTNHALNYGLGYKKFALMNEIKEADAKMLHEQAMLAYPGIRVYHNWIENALRDNNQTLTNLLGRRRKFLDEMPSPYNNSSLLTKAYAYIPQSTIADIINTRGLYYIYWNIPEVKLLNQIHDSIVFEIPLSVPIERHIEILNSIKQRLEEPLVWKDKSFVIEVEIKCGTNFGNMKKLSKPEELESHYGTTIR